MRITIREKHIFANLQSLHSFQLEKVHFALISTHSSLYPIEVCHSKYIQYCISAKPMNVIRTAQPIHHSHQYIQHALCLLHSSVVSQDIIAYGMTVLVEQLIFVSVMMLA